MAASASVAYNFSLFNGDDRSNPEPIQVWMFEVRQMFARVPAIGMKGKDVFNMKIREADLNQDVNSAVFGLMFGALGADMKDRVRRKPDLEESGRKLYEYLMGEFSDELYISHISLTQKLLELESAATAEMMQRNLDMILNQMDQAKMGGDLYKGILPHAFVIAHQNLFLARLTPRYDDFLKVFIKEHQGRCTVPEYFRLLTQCQKQQEVMDKVTVSTSGMAAVQLKKLVQKETAVPKGGAVAGVKACHGCGSVNHLANVCFKLHPKLKEEQQKKWAAEKSSKESSKESWETGQGKCGCGDGGGSVGNVCCRVLCGMCSRSY